MFWLFDYGPGHALPLALFWLVMSIAWAVGWIIVLERKGLAGPWLVVVPLLPFPVFYQFAIGTDLPFAVLFLAFYAAYHANKAAAAPWLWLLPLVLLTVTRAAVLSVFAFVVVDMAREWWLGRRPGAFTLLVTAALVLFGLTIHLPWLGVFTNYSVSSGDTSNSFTFFGIAEPAYRAGLLPNTVPDFINISVSWAALLGAKVLYFCGFRLSFESFSMLATFMRVIPAILVVIPGLIACLLRGEARDRMIVVLVLLPALIGLAQERYNLPLLPLFVFYGAQMWRLFADRIFHRQGSDTAR